MSLELITSFSDFYAPGATITVRLPASWPQLVRVAATVGRDVPWTTVGVDSRFLQYERAWRIAMMRSCLRETTTGPGSARIARTSAYASLDPSEKGAVSFFLGQASAKYVAETMFGCVLFAHFDSARRYCGMEAVGQRPDFIGVCSDGRILVVEAKGRSSALGGVLEAAKSQLASIKGGDLTYASAAFFRGDELRVAMLDPEERSAEALPIRGILQAYYNPLRGLVSGGVERLIAGRRYRVISFEGLEVEMGLAVEVLEELDAVEHGDDLAAEDMWQRIRVRNAERNVEGTAAQDPAVRDFELRRETSRSSDESALQRRTRRRTFRRPPPDPELEDIAARAAAVGGVTGADESFVRVGRAWVSEEMQLDPADRAPR